MKIHDHVRAVIVEDEPLARQTIKDFVADENWLEVVGEAPDGNQAIELIDDLKPDLLFLDLKMPGLTGLEVLQKAKHDPEVVFTTAYGDQAVTAFELEAIDYVLKPFGQARFRQVLERVRRRLIDTEQSRRESHPTNNAATKYLERFFVRDAAHRIVQVRASEINRLAGAGDYVELFANKTAYLVNLTLNAFAQRLDPSRFCRVHRSTIVNLDHIASCKEVNRRLAIKLTDGTELIASRSGSQILRDLFV